LAISNSQLAVGSPQFATANGWFKNFINVL